MNPNFVATEGKGHSSINYVILKYQGTDTICTVVRKNKDDKVFEDRGNSPSLIKRKVRNWLQVVFLPKGYPHSVSPDYMEYQIWDSLQAYCSNLAGALSLHSTLIGIGVGEENASPLAAALSWLLKDGAGMVSSIAFAYYKGSELDNNSKQWRLFADVANDGAHLIKLLAPFLPFPFLVTLCVSSVMSSLVGVAGGATRASLIQHQALMDNMADVSAKDGSQETMVNLAGLVTSLTLLPYLTSSHLITWMTFVLCVLLHLYTNYMAMRSLRMKTLNRPRLLYVFEQYTNRAFVPDVVSANKCEPLLFGPAFIQDYLTMSFRLRAGVSLSSVFQHFRVKREEFTEQFEKQKQSFVNHLYMIFLDLNFKIIFIVFHGSASEEQHLQSFWAGYLLALNLEPTKERISSEFKVTSVGAKVSDLIMEVSSLAQNTFKKIPVELQNQGWILEPLRLDIGEWKITPAELP